MRVDLNIFHTRVECTIVVPLWVQIDASLHLKRPPHTFLLFSPIFQHLKLMDDKFQAKERIGRRCTDKEID